MECPVGFLGALRRSVLVITAAVGAQPAIN
jgi:hypothetical protein